MKVRHQNRQGGFALIITLCVLVLLVALVVGFFSRVQVETQSSSSYEAAQASRSLNDSTVNVVLAQIQAATSGTSGGQTLTWASQPGAIRTYNTSGNLVSVYKLYSSGTMVPDSIAPATEAANLSGWFSKPALFTDLNEPISGEYPILDPGILDLSAAQQPQGFSVTSAPMDAVAAIPNRIPMPAQWLYVLQDGSFVAPGSASTAAIADIPGASKDNKIVGRVAFWTDDETSKINVNTAGGGLWTEPDINVGVVFDSNSTLPYQGPGMTSFWSTPVVSSVQDGVLAQNQPAQSEFQRYPGHPANTFLTAAMPYLATTTDIYSALPRLEDQNSSQGGKVRPTTISFTTDRFPLYESVDEFLFTGTRGTNAGFDAANLKYTRFFLTANSRSPDVNLFNEPRIGMWPVAQEASKRTPFDQLIAFCETIPATATGNRYYFQRSNPDSPTVDISEDRNDDILAYLDKKLALPPPGFGGPSGILRKYGAENEEQTLTAIFDYIRSTNPRDSSQTKNNAVDTSYYYSLSGAVVPSERDGMRGYGRYPTITKAGLLFYCVAVNQASAPQNATPDYINRKVYDKDKTVHPPGLNPPLRIGTPEAPGSPPAPGMARLRAILLLEMFIPGQGYHLVRPRCTVNVSGLGNFTWPGGGGMFKSPTGSLVFTDATTDWDKGFQSVEWGGRISFQQVAGTALGDSYPFASDVGSTSLEVPCREDNSAATFGFGGGTIQVEILSGGVSLQTLSLKIPSATVPVPYLSPLVFETTTSTVSHDFRILSERINTQKTNAYLTGWIRKEDVVRAVTAKPQDFRLTAAMKEVPDSMFTEHSFYGDQTKSFAHNFMLSYPMAFFGAGLGSYVDIGKANTALSGRETVGSPVYSVAINSGNSRQYDNKANDNLNTKDGRTYMVDTLSTGGVLAGDDAALGDWDNGVGRANDGPYVNYPDEGVTNSAGAAVPYLGFVATDNVLNNAFFSPNRIMPSAVMLGSLPTQAVTVPAKGLVGKPWQTLLFRPSAVKRLGAGEPLTGPPFTQAAPDYLLLDFFNMPVVQPYAISEPLSTAGRVNMNYQILPYTYINRSTGVQAVLRSEQMMTIPNAVAASTKEQSSPLSARLRTALNLSDTTGTLKGFADRFAKGDIFRSPSEICSIWLVPDTGASYASMATWWDGYLPTGDNVKESSYARIYPRLTTKSNTYTIHARVQVLKNPNQLPDQGKWDESKGKILAEYRGSTTVERYVDAKDPKIPDYIAPNPAPPEPLSKFYKFRILNQQRFGR